MFYGGVFFCLLLYRYNMSTSDLPLSAFPETLTVDDLSAIDAAIASGLRVVEFRDRRSEFRSHDDLLRARAFVIARLKAQDGVQRAHSTIVYHRYAGRGY